MAKKYLSLERLTEYDTLIKSVIKNGDDANSQALAEHKASHAPANAERNIIVGIQKNGVDLTVDGNRKVNIAVPTKPEDISAAPVEHDHDGRYYTETEIDSKISAINSSIDNIKNGNAPVAEATHASTADTATNATNAENATKATQDGNGKVISSTYETKDDANAKLDEAKAYTNTEVAKKANVSHTHAIADVTDLQTTLDEKASTSHKHDDAYDTKGSAANALERAKDYANTLSRYNTFSFSNYTSTYAQAPDGGDGAQTVIASGADSLKVKAGNNLINFDVIENGFNGDEVTITVNADPEGSADAALEDAKDYTDEKIALLMNNSSEAVDSIMELAAAMKDNADAIEALEGIASGKANATHTHAIADVNGLQSALDGKAASSHGTHVTYSNTAPVMDGTASAGSASTVARSDHIHPTDTSRASQVDLDALESVVAGKANSSHTHTIANVTNLQSTLDAKAAQTSLDTHTSNTTAHITAAERTNWNAAKTHADSAHAPVNAQANVIESIKVNGTAQTITNKGVNITVPTKTSDLTHDSGFLVAADIANKADKATTLSGYGITDAYTKTEIDEKTSVDDALSATSTKPVQNKVVNSAISALTSAVTANTSSIGAHTTAITNLQNSLAEIEDITSEEIRALFAK